MDAFPIALYPLVGNKCFLLTSPPLKFFHTNVTWTGRVDWSERLVNAGTPAMPGASSDHHHRAASAPTFSE